MRHWALEKLRALEERHGVRSVAFENLGPPRLTKLLFEADLLRRTFGTMEAVRASTPTEMSVRAAEEIGRDADYRGEIVSIGIPILLPDGRLLRGPECKIPPVPVPSETLEVTEERVDAWAHAGWVDLREPNMARVARALPAHRGRDRRHPRRRLLVALPPRPPVLERGGPHPAGQGDRLDLRHRGEGRADEMTAASTPAPPAPASSGSSGSPSPSTWA